MRPFQRMAHHNQRQQSRALPPHSMLRELGVGTEIRYTNPHRCDVLQQRHHFSCGSVITLFPFVLTIAKPRLLRPGDRVSDLVRVFFLSLLAGTQRSELTLYLVDLFVGAVLEADKLVTSPIDAPKNFIEL